MLFSGPFFGGVASANFSVEFWFKPDSNASQTLYVKNGSRTSYGGGLANVSIKTSTDGSLIFNAPMGNVGSLSSAPNLITAGQWQHIAVTMELGYPWGYPGPHWPLLTVYLNGISVITYQQDINTGGTYD